jgi:hypothetical protein
VQQIRMKEHSPIRPPFRERSVIFRLPWSIGVEELDFSISNLCYVYVEPD